MRIALIVYGSIDTLSGGYLYDRMLVEYMKSRGDQVAIISIPWRDYARNLLDNFSISLYKKLVDLPVDLVLQDELNHPSLFILNKAISRKRDFKIISIVHHLRSSEANPKLVNYFYRWVEKQYLQHVDGFVYNSISTQDSVEKLTKKNRPSVMAYPAGDRLHPEISHSQVAARSKLGGPLQIIFLGNVTPRKGLHVLLEALREIPPEYWRLTVVGSLGMDPRYAEEIRRSVHRSGIEKLVSFTGPLDERDLRSRLYRSQLMAVPSFHEGFGIAYLEGMGFGLPAIASSDGGAGEFVTHGVDGYLVPPGNPSLLYEYILRLSSDRVLLSRMSLAALNRYRNHSTWEESNSRIRYFLEKMSH